MENFEQKYNEMVKRARELHEAGNALTKKQMEIVCPELVESEDERVRKALIDGVSQIRCKGDITREQMIAYLEKQKEQKPNIEICPHSIKSKSYSNEQLSDEKIKPIFKVGDSVNLNNREDEEYNILTIVGINYVEQCYRCDQGSTIDFKEQNLWHTVEQKPIESYPIENCDYGLEIALTILQKTYGKVEGYQTDDGIREHQTAIQAVKDAMKEHKPLTTEETELNSVAFLTEMGYTCIPPSKDGMIEKKIDALMKEQKPVEWSEEDEKMKERLITRLNWITYNTRTDGTSPNITFFDEINWLKSLRPQPHWKLSSQELGALRTAVHILTEERSFPKAAKQIQNIIDVFDGQELRKEWKPSEEQMDALNYAIAEWDGGKKLEGLYSLRNELKKL